MDHKSQALKSNPKLLKNYKSIWELVDIIEILITVWIMLSMERRLDYNSLADIVKLKSVK
jgi:hypothetical protein